MKTIVLAAIAGYQRYISPHKGYRCAYTCRTGHRSCSALGYRAIRMHGAWFGVAVLLKRFERCAAAAKRHTNAPRLRKSQAGFCDIGCPCDIPSCDLPSIECGHGASSALECCSFSPCDCGSCGEWRRSSKETNDEKYVYIPPNKWADARHPNNAPPDA